MSVLRFCVEQPALKLAGFLGWVVQSVASRVLSFYSACNETWTRSRVQALIKRGKVTVNNDPTTKPAQKLAVGDIVVVDLNEERNTQDELFLSTPLDILFNDSHLAVIHKPAGLVVHPTPGHSDACTLVTLLRRDIGQLSDGSEPERPGIVHRLDRDTAGLMVIAKTNEAHEKLKSMFEQRQVDKRYQAIVLGKPKAENEWNFIDKPIAHHPNARNQMCIHANGKVSLSEYSLLGVYTAKKKLFSHLSVKIHTGRTHQIRVHLSSISTPIIGDPIYSSKAKAFSTNLMLAACRLSFAHPFSGESLTFEREAPAYFREFLNTLTECE
jgi:23S rRNA pseudouridine1911/1915/1917 synthase